MNCVVISCLFVVVSSPANNGMSYMNDSSSENASETLMDKFNKEIFSYLIQFFQAHVLRPVKGGHHCIVSIYFLFRIIININPLIIIGIITTVMIIDQQVLREI